MGGDGGRQWRLHITQCRLKNRRGWWIHRQQLRRIWRGQHARAQVRPANEGIAALIRVTGYGDRASPAKTFGSLLGDRPGLLAGGAETCKSPRISRILTPPCGRTSPSRVPPAAAVDPGDLAEDQELGLSRLAPSEERKRAGMRLGHGVDWRPVFETRFSSICAAGSRSTRTRAALAVAGLHRGGRHVVERGERLGRVALIRSVLPAPGKASAPCPPRTR